MSGPIWTSSAIAQATGGRASGTWSVAGVSIDSRTVQPGELFVALRGPRHDGHDFVAAALARGAAAMVERVPDAVRATAPLVVVDDTLKALTALGVAGRVRSRAATLAITGSVGKTGVKEALRLTLAAQGPTHASVASHNNHWGVPLALARQPADAAFAVYELGMNHAGEIDALVRLVRPHVALVTAIAPAHLGFFASIEAIADAKAEIFRGVEPGGIAVLPADSPYVDRLEAHARAAGCTRIVTFGEAADAAVRLIDARLDADGSDVTLHVDGQEIACRVGAPGRHWVQNSLAVVAAATALGADPGRVARALCDFTAPAGRGARQRLPWKEGTITLIDESHNANPASMQAALALLGQGQGRKLAVLADMRELGEQGPALHAELADPVAAAGIDLVFTAGPLMEQLYRALPARRRGAHAPSTEALLPELLAAIRPGDVVLVKGSFGSRTGLIVDGLRAAAEAALAPAGEG